MKQSAAQNKDETFAMTQLTELTTLFERNKKQYTSVYDEANTRTDFIDKFFELLGWDIRNEQGYSEQYREVVREDKVTICGKVKAPDYAFRIGGLRKFFVEAKKPSVNIKDELEPAFQVRRYGYTAKLPLCILTDFEEFAVYDTRIKPSSSDKPSAARIFYCTFDEYHKHFDFIFNTFSKEAILKGSFDTYIQENKNKKGTSEVDKELLKLIEGWRTDIAKNIALRNPSLDIYHLNTAVQKIIDRIIFLRIAEDKEMEEYGLLQKITESGTVYQKLQSVFDKANAKYNSGLFTPHDWLRSLTIDDAVLSSIINGLYYPECPYEFSILPVEILGNIYEQFLGKIITFRNIGGRVSSDRTNTRHTAIIEEKPEVKKAGGVYYTPQYIVRYIVENTLGVKIKGQSPDAVAKLKVVDPACGSGSFLVEAYQQLLNYHLDYYSSEKVRKQALKNSLIYETGKSVYKLTIEEKQRILLNNIYGVDIDGQAVEVTKLSLYLKLLENEGRETQGQLFKFSDIKLLPSLDSNIKCGNSLVSSDYYHEKDLSLFDDEAMRKINTFDWDKEFPEVFAQGGFDCVIGNPPYVRRTLLNSDSKTYYEKKYESAINQYDLYLLFIEKGLTLLNKGGCLSFINPIRFFNADYGEGCRKFILRNYKLAQIIDISQLPIFINASTYPCILIIENDKQENCSISFAVCESIDDFIKINEKYFNYVSQSEIEENPECKIIINSNLKLTRIIKKIDKNKIELKEYFNIARGLPNAKVNFRKGKFLALKSKQVKRYACVEEYTKIDTDFFEGFDYEMIIMPRTVLSLESTIKEKYIISLDRIYYLIKKQDISLLYVIALINSKLITSWFDYYYSTTKIRGGYFDLNGNQIGSIPIYEATSEDQAPFITLADQMLETQRRLQQALSDDDKKLLEQRVAILDKQIDNAVYKLYNLTADEVKIVEGE